MQERKSQSRAELLQEIKLDNLSTKQDVLLVRQDLQMELSKFELKINEKINGAKWQVIGAVAAMLFVEIALKHFGV